MGALPPNPRGISTTVMNCSCGALRRPQRRFNSVYRKKATRNHKTPLRASMGETGSRKTRFFAEESSAETKSDILFQNRRSLADFHVHTMVSGLMASMVADTTYSVMSVPGAQSPIKDLLSSLGTTRIFLYPLACSMASISDTEEAPAIQPV